MFKRILMNAADGSPGNGAPAIPPVDVPPAQDEPKAQGAPTPSVSIDDFKQLMSTVSELAKSVNSLHAADRRAREGKQPPAADLAKPGTTPNADDPSSLLALRDAFDDATSEMKLTKGQRSLLRESVMSKRIAPSDVDGYVQDYASRAGWSATTQAQQPDHKPANTAPPQPQNAIPASDRGSPPPPKAPLAEADILKMSESDRLALVREKGIKWFAERARAQAKGRQVQWR